MLQFTRIYTNDYNYHGYNLNEQFEGEGKIIYHNHQKYLAYEGEFSNNKFNGYGILIYRDGNKFQGFFENNQTTNNGLLYNDKGLLIKNYINNIVYKYNSNKILQFEGVIINNKKEGLCYEYHDGLEIPSFIGEYKNNIRIKGIEFDIQGNIKYQITQDKYGIVKYSSTIKDYSSLFIPYDCDLSKVSVFEYNNKLKQLVLIYEGQYKYIDNKIIYEGYGKVAIKNNNYYTQFLSGKFEKNVFIEGKLSLIKEWFNKLSYQNMTFYPDIIEGIFELDKFKNVTNFKLEKNFKVYYKNNVTYDIKVVDNKYIGKAFDYAANNFIKQYYEGEFKVLPDYYVKGKFNIIKDGIGREFDGSYNHLIYEGDYKNNYRDGLGKLYKNGKLCYHGEFMNNHKYGIGKDYDQNNMLIFEGSYYNGSRHGTGKLYENSQLVYHGNFLNNKKHGEGKIYDKNNVLIYEGQFLNNTYHGKGKLYENSHLVYDGNFFNNKKEGKGTLYDNGIPIITTSFKDDNII